MLVNYLIAVCVSFCQVFVPSRDNWTNGDEFHKFSTFFELRLHSDEVHRHLLSFYTVFVFRKL